MIYFIQCGENGPIKIGQSDDPWERLKQLQIANPYDLKLIWVYKGNDFTEDELHEKFKLLKIRNEWFKPSENIFEFINEELVNSYDIKLLNGKSLGISEYYPIGDVVGIYYDKVDLYVNLDKGTVSLPW